MPTEMLSRFLSSHWSLKICVIISIFLAIGGFITSEPTKFYFVGAIVATIAIFAFYNDRRLRKEAGDE